MDNLSNSGASHEDLLVYKQAIVIFDLNHLFCRQFLAHPSKRRTVDQMEQADRSGKQNIVEGSLEKSLKLNIKLKSVARASYGELLEDYLDYLRLNNLALWDKNDERLKFVRQQHNQCVSDYKSYLSNRESFANLMITLINKENYLLDRLIASLEEKFITEGGYSENLFQKRRQYKSNSRFYSET